MKQLNLFLRQQSLLEFPYTEDSTVRIRNSSGIGAEFECGPCHTYLLSEECLFQNIFLSTVVYMAGRLQKTKYLLWKMARCQNACIEKLTTYWQAGRPGNISQEEIQGWNPLRNKCLCHLIQTMSSIYPVWWELDCHSMKSFAIIMKFHMNSIFIIKHF